MGNAPRHCASSTCGYRRYCNRCYRLLYRSVASLTARLLNRDVRERVSAHPGLDPGPMRPGRMSYDLRRLRLHGLVERIDGSYRYRLTEQGLKIAMFYTRVYNRILRPGLSHLAPEAVVGNSAMHRRFTAMTNTINDFCDQAKLAA